MSVRVELAAEAPAPYEALLAADSRADLFVTPSWRKALLRGYPRFRIGFLLLEEGGHPAGILPVAETRPFGFREVVSLPFGTPGGPFLAPHASEEGLCLLIGAFRNLVRGARTVRYELTVNDPPAPMREELEAAFPGKLLSARRHRLDLTPGPGDLWKRYDQRLRRSVRIAERAEVRVDRQGREALDVFQELYVVQAREFPLVWHHARSALEGIVEELGEGAAIWVARHRDRPVAAQLALYDRGRDVHLWLSGSRPEARPIAAFHRLLHELVKEASGDGYTGCNFGSSLGLRGVERFKEAFGAVSHPLLRFYHQEGWVDWLQRARWGAPWSRRKRA
jgi:hypothetical protein